MGSSEMPTLLITGVAAGFGASIARTFAAAGHDVVGPARSDRSAAHLARLVDEGGGAYAHLICDVTLPAEVADVLRSHTERIAASWREPLCTAADSGRAVGINVTIFKPELDRDGSIAKPFVYSRVGSAPRNPTVKVVMPGDRPDSIPLVVGLYQRDLLVRCGIPTLMACHAAIMSQAQ